MSPPAWWCGLKSVEERLPKRKEWVTTCVVVWIEISIADLISFFCRVTTCVVVWIEIPLVTIRRIPFLSPPAWWCGLKSPHQTPD